MIPIKRYEKQLLELFSAVTDNTEKRRDAYRRLRRRVWMGSLVKSYKRYEKHWVYRKALQVFDEMGHETSQFHEGMARRFYRMKPSDRALIMMTDCLKIPESDLPSIFGIPLDSIQLRREQILGALQLTDDPPVVSLDEFFKQNRHIHLTKNLKGRDLWDQAPWYIRSGIEGLSIALIVLGLVVAAPKLKNISERAINKRMESFEGPVEFFQPSVEELSEEPTNEELAQQCPQPKGSTEIDCSKKSAVNAIKVGEQEIWRFNLKSISPKESRMRMVQILKKAGIEDSEGIGYGIEAPGGIQFNVLVPTDKVLVIKSEIEKLAQQMQKTASQSFTWFKNKGRSDIPKGMTRVIVWLSQI